MTARGTALSTQTRRTVPDGQPPPDTAHSCLVPERDWWSSGVRYTNSHLLPSPQTLPIQTQELPRKGVNEEDLHQQVLSPAPVTEEGSSERHWLLIWLFIPPPIQITAQSIHSVLWIWTPFGRVHISHLCALLMNSTAASQGGEKGVWDLWLLHLAYICISGICAKCIQIILSSLQIETTGIACIMWKMYLIDFYQGQSSSVRLSERGMCYLPVQSSSLISVS